MRIHSPRGGSLYRRRRGEPAPSRPPAVPPTRILRLGIVVAVLLLVMHRASQPGAYTTLLGDRWFIPATTVSTAASQTPAPAPRPELTDTAAAELSSLSALIDDGLDGTVWRAADRPALNAALAMHRRLIDPQNPDDAGLRRWFDAAPAGGVIALLQQPQTYRGTAVAASGQIASARPVEDAFHLWLRPDDGSDRPWLTIVPVMPPELTGLLGRELSPPLPKVVVAGTYLKRLAYQSAAGAELTPVVVGHVVRFAAAGNAIVQPAMPSGTAAATPSQEVAEGPAGIPARGSDWSWGHLAAAIIIGVATAVWLQRSSIAERRRSLARRRETPVELP